MTGPSGRGASATARIGLGLVIAALFAGVAPAAAQEAGTSTPSAAAPSTPGVGSQPGDLVPDELGGYAADITLTRGREHLDGLDADDPADAATLAELAALLAATGRPVEDLTTALAFVSTDELFAFVVAFRIAGAPQGTILPTYLPLLLDDLAVTRQDSAELGGREVLVVYSDEGDGEVPLYILAEGDTVWLLQGPEHVVMEALEGLGGD